MNTALFTEQWGFVAHKVFSCGAVAGVTLMTFGKYRIVLCLDDPMFFDDGW